VPSEPDLDVVVVGAGFSGLYLLHRLRAMGLRVRVLERAPGVGGTWHWNRYPGARCDIESVDYQYSFDPELVKEWRWKERYAAQPEILAYLEHVADRYDLRRDITFGVTVESATYDDATGTWTLATDGGKTVTTRWCVMATGNLSAVKPPDIPGLDTFDGTWLHTGEWPAEPVELEGKRVAVVGTGSSGVQTITALAPQVGRLFVLQRTPNYSMPAHNRPLEQDEWEGIVQDFAERRYLCETGDAGTPLPLPTTPAVAATPEERRARYEAGWAMGGISSLSFAYNDMFRDERSNAYAAEFAREKIRSIVKDPVVADKLCPTHHIGTKRTCTDTGYFETFNRDNVELVDLSDEPIEEIVPTGIRTSARTIDVDVIVFAIGFDAITGAMAEIDVRGRGGMPLSQAWEDGPRTYLGLQVAGFPNLFMVTGPASPSVLSNMVVSIEQHVDWIADCIAHLDALGLSTIEATEAAEAAWAEHVNAAARRTVFLSCNSWYLGANIPGKPRMFMPLAGGFPQYAERCAQVARSGYEGFALA
jgi:cyclohexanone monooxygenase